MMHNKFNADAEIRKHWLLREDIHFLNHGSFGATPRAVLEVQQAWQQRMEMQPVSFFVRDLPELIRDAVAKLADFLGANAEHLAFVENATSAINAILRAYPWQAGDEILLSEHAYPAVKNAAYFVAKQFKLSVKEYAVPFPLQNPVEITASFERAIATKTKLAIIDHISSPLAIIYPLDDMLQLCRQHRIHSLVDGAHVPGMLPLQLLDIDADYYVGNCHKWLFAPKGCAFLWASPAVSENLQPLVVSLRMDEGFPRCFDWTGTRDVSAWLTISAAIDFYQQMGGQDIPQQLHHFAIEMATMLTDAWNVEIPAGVEQFGAMFTLPVPWAKTITQIEANDWRDRLWKSEQIEVPFLAINERLWVRISAQLYNTKHDYERLAEAVLKVIDQ